MNLPISPEPTSVKEKLKKDFEKEDEYAFPHPSLTIARLAKANIKQGTWIASYLWTQCKWKDILKHYGISWQKFVEAVRDNYYSFISWVKGEKSWEEAIKDLIAIIKRKPLQHF